MWVTAFRIWMGRWNKRVIAAGRQECKRENGHGWGWESGKVGTSSCILCINPLHKIYSQSESEFWMACDDDEITRRRHA